MNIINFIILLFPCTMGAVINNFYPDCEKSIYNLGTRRYKIPDSYGLIIYNPFLQVLSGLLIYGPTILSFFVNPWWSAFLLFFLGNTLGKTISRSLFGFSWLPQLIPILSILSLISLILLLF